MHAFLRKKLGIMLFCSGVIHCIFSHTIGCIKLILGELTGIHIRRYIWISEFQSDFSNWNNSNLVILPQNAFLLNIEIIGLNLFFVCNYKGPFIIRNLIGDKYFWMKMCFYVFFSHDVWERQN